MEDNYIMKILKLGILCSAIICIIACNTYPKIKSGGYLAYKAKAFIFSSDSTFVYKESIDRISTGKWSLLKNNTLILNSKKQSRLALLKAEVMLGNNKQTKISVKLNVYERNDEDYVCRPVIDGKISDLYTGVGSYSFYLDRAIDSLYFILEKRPQQVEVLGMQQPDYYAINTNHITLNYTTGDEVILHISLTDSLFSYRIFTDEKLKIKNNEIIFSDKEKKVKKTFQLVFE